MKKIFPLFLLVFSVLLSAQTYSSDSVSTYIFIKQNDDVIEAKNQKTLVNVDFENGSINAVLNIEEFKFYKEKNISVFFDDIMEYKTFAQATFNGTLQQVKGGKYYITGKMNIKGIDVDVNFPATITQKEGGIAINGSFTLMYPDFEITVPKKKCKGLNSEVVVTIKSFLTAESSAN